jgi:hypothetical protein
MKTYPSRHDLHITDQTVQFVQDLSVWRVAANPASDPTASETLSCRVQVRTNAMPCGVAYSLV